MLQHTFVAPIRWLLAQSALFFATLLLPFSSSAGQARVDVDFSHTVGKVRPLHGINKGPIAFGGLIDLTDQQKRFGVPHTRLHDCQWPYPDVVDIHAIFRNPEADPNRPENYDFALTDEYMAAVVQTGTQIIYRLGESIEHASAKRFVHPPRDFEQWTAICRGVIRHYNEGWANGFRYGIQYWEIWNEPENRPAMWSGSDADFIRLYRTAAKGLKRDFPKLKIGGPAFGHSGKFVGGKFQPSAFVTNFLATCRREQLPLDFFSWHCYTADPEELVSRSKAIRELLDSYGFQKTENHLNEWNYLPRNSWDPISKTAAPEARQKHYEEMAGVAGAAFVTTALIGLQDAPVDVCNFFHGELGGFGIFNEHGVPTPNYYAMLAFNELSQSERALAKTERKIATVAGVKPGHNTAAVLISNFQSDINAIELNGLNLPDYARKRYEVYHLSANQSWSRIQEGAVDSSSLKLSLPLTAPSIILVKLSNP